VPGVVWACTCSHHMRPFSLVTKAHYVPGVVWACSLVAPICFLRFLWRIMAALGTKLAYLRTVLPA
jgi:hypothetical protein